MYRHQPRDVAPPVVCANQCVTSRDVCHQYRDIITSTSTSVAMYPHQSRYTVSPVAMYSQCVMCYQFRDVSSPVTTASPVAMYHQCQSIAMCYQYRDVSSPVPQSRCTTSINQSRCITSFAMYHHQSRPPFNPDRVSRSGKLIKSAFQISRRRKS